MSRPAPPNRGDQDVAPWTLILIVFAVAVFWWVAHTQVATVVMWIRYVEAHLLFFDPVGRQALARWLGSTVASEATMAGLFQSGSVAGWSLRWFSLGFLLVWFVWLIRCSPARTGRYAQRYSMRSLAEQEAAQWPVLTPVLGLNLQDVPLDDPINGMRMDGRRYARQHKLLHPRWTDPTSILKPDGTAAEVEQLEDGRWIDVTRTRALFSSQLGRLWEGVEALRPYERALYAAFVAQIGYDKTLPLEIVNELALSAREAFAKKDSSLLDAASAKDAIERYGNTPQVQKLVRGHRHVRTVLIALLAAARANGVLPTAWFRWLKMADRRTWYALNDLGLDVASVEAAGIRAHYQAETIAKTSIIEPLINPAVDGLIEYLNTYLDEEHEKD